MRLAVTGGTGTVGQAFIECAASVGHSIVLLGRNAPAEMPDNCEWVEFDLTQPPISLGQTLAGVDSVVHLAASIDTNPTNDADSTSLWTTNVLGTGRLIEAVAKAGVRHFIMASSANIYDPGVDRADEATLIRPHSRTLYLSSKIAQEAYARELCTKHKIDHAILRISSVIGTGKDIATKFLEMTLGNEIITLTNPEYGADFVSLCDVAEGLLIAVQKRLEGEFNLSSGERYTLEDMVHTIANVCAVPVRINESGPHRALDNGFPAIDCSRLSAHGYNPTTLPDTFADMKAILLQKQSGQEGARQ